MQLRKSHTNCDLANVVPHVCHATIICQSKCMVKASECHVMLRRIEATQPQVVPKLSIADPCRSSLALLPPWSVRHDVLCICCQHTGNAPFRPERVGGTHFVRHLYLKPQTNVQDCTALYSLTKYFQSYTGTGMLPGNPLRTRLAALVMFVHIGRHTRWKHT